MLLLNSEIAGRRMRKLSVILIISIFLLVAASLSTLRSKRSPSQGEARSLPPEPQYRGLFEESQTSLYDGDKAVEAETARRAAELLRASLLERAAEGDTEALLDAHAAGNTSLYREVLDALVRCVTDEKGGLRALSGFIARRGELRSSPALAEVLLEEWGCEPTSSDVPELLRVAALSDDAATFRAVVENVFEVWDEGRLPELSAAELDALFKGEYWLLSSDARRSGTGFVLNRTLAELRRRLQESARRDDHPPSAGADREKASH